MEPVTTTITVSREFAEAIRDCMIERALLADALPEAFPAGALSRYASYELIAGAAVDRISYLERKPAVKDTFRHRLAANIAFPNIGVKGW